MKKAYKLMLDEAVYEQLRHEAFEQKTSISEVVRRRLGTADLVQGVTRVYEVPEEMILPVKSSATNAVTYDPQIPRDDSFGKARPAPKPGGKK